MERSFVLSIIISCKTPFPLFVGAFRRPARVSPHGEEIIAGEGIN